jgi:hypothetical protein
MQQTWLENTFDRYSLTPTEIFIAYMAIGFFMAGLGLILTLFYSRIKKSNERRRTLKLREQFQKILNAIVVNETFSEKPPPVSAFEYRMAELRFILGRSSFARQTLINQLLEIKKNLTGNSSLALVRTYHQLMLYEHSLANLNSLAWQKKALAIRELAEMGHRPSIDAVAKFLYARQQALREESFMALIRLEEKPLSFLNQYKRDLSTWMRINIYNYLSKMDPRTLPLFSQWFNHENASVVLFSISMARQFRQSASVPGLVALLYSPNPKVVGLVVSTLGELEAYQCRDEIARLALHAVPFEKLAVRIIRCLGKIGDMTEDVRLVGSFLSHPAYTVRFEAVAALKKLGAAGQEFLQTYEAGPGTKNIDAILRHFSEPLLT